MVFLKLARRRSWKVFVEPIGSMLLAVAAISDGWTGLAENAFRFFNESLSTVFLALQELHLT